MPRKAPPDSLPAILGSLAPPTAISEPPQKKSHDLEWQIPEITTSPLTGLPNVPTWGQLNKFSIGSRYAIGDSDSDDEYNWLPMGGTKIQVPTAGPVLTTIPGSGLIWKTEIFYSGQLYSFALSTNGHLYQITPGGVQTDIWQTAQFSTTGNLTIGQPTVTNIPSTANISVGMGISGTGIPANTTVIQVNSSTQITMSANATANSTGGAITFSTPLFTTSGVVDITVWENNIILISDSAAQNVYSWNGSHLLIVFTQQPVQYITVSQQRLWMGFNLTLQWTEVGTYNSLAGDSGSYLIADSQCSEPINCLLDTPLGLFASAANWIKTITGLQDIGTPAVLIFQQNTIEGQIGPMTKWSVVIVGNVLFFANSSGIWQLSGSQPGQISAGFLNQFFANMNWSNTSLSGTYAMINGVPLVLWQGYYNGDQNASPSVRIFGFVLQSQQWFSLSPSNVGNAVWISGAVSVSNTNQNPFVWAVDQGNHFYQLFVNTTTSERSQLNTKLWPFGSPLDQNVILNVAIEMIAGGPCSVTVAYVNENNVPVVGSPATPTQSITAGVLTFVNNMGQPIQFVNNSGQPINFTGAGQPQYFLAQFDGLSGRPRRFGINVEVNGYQCVLIGIVVSIHRSEASRGA
jgi:hypothetical protein